MSAIRESSAFAVRLRALLRKEFRQMLRDRSNIMMGLLLPVILIYILGFGISFDIEQAPVAAVVEDHSVEAQRLVQGLSGSRYLSVVRAGSMPEAEALVQQGKVHGILRIPPDFAENCGKGGAQAQLILNGVDAQNVRTVEGYVAAGIASWAAKELDRRGASASGGVQVVQRVWFNEPSISTWFLVPGIITLILTLIGAFLASLLIAREWERGTFESLFVTPVRPAEIVIAKVAPYACIGVADIALCLLAARFLFEVPVRGSIALIFLVSLLFLFVSLLLGLAISGLTRSQFLASQVALLASFLPSMMLSGFVFDIRNMPGWLVPVCNVLPATHFMKLAKQLFLAGNLWGDVAQGVLILTGYGLLFAFAATKTLEKRLR